MGAKEDTIGQVVSWYICTVAAMAFLALRLTFRMKKMGGLKLDDYLITAAFGFMVVDLAIQHRMWDIGMADTSTTSQSHLIQLMKFIYPGSVFYITALWLIKTALVVFYKRLADRTYLQKVYNVALIWLAITWTILFLDIIFYCFPVRRKWSTDPSQSCPGSGARVYFWLLTIFNITSDLLIICLPISMVLRLRLPIRQKIGVAGVFALGFLVVITSIIRAIFSHRNETMLTCTVSMIETATAIIATCLPTLRTLFLGHTSRHGSYLQKPGSHDYALGGSASSGFGVGDGHSRYLQTPISHVTTISGGQNRKHHRKHDSDEELVKDIHSLPSASTAPTTAKPSMDESFGKGASVEVVRESDSGDIGGGDGRREGERLGVDEGGGNGNVALGV